MCMAYKLVAMDLDETLLNLCTKSIANGVPGLAMSGM